MVPVLASTRASGASELEDGAVGLGLLEGVI